MTSAYASVTLPSVIPMAPSSMTTPQAMPRHQAQPLFDYASMHFQCVGLVLQWLRLLFQGFDVCLQAGYAVHASVLLWPESWEPPCTWGDDSAFTTTLQSIQVLRRTEGCPSPQEGQQ
jgi:hypothetical protein